MKLTAHVGGSDSPACRRSRRVSSIPQPLRAVRISLRVQVAQAVRDEVPVRRRSVACVGADAVEPDPGHPAPTGSSFPIVVASGRRKGRRAASIASQPGARIFGGGILVGIVRDRRRELARSPAHQPSQQAHLLPPVRLVRPSATEPTQA